MPRPAATNVELWRDNPSYARKGGGAPVVYRYEVQGPGAMNVIRELLGEEPPTVKFFHGTRFTIRGKMVRALRHGMAGEPGFEFVGPWADREVVHAALLEAGKKHGMVEVGGRAYLTNTLESGWLPRPLPAFYSGASTKNFRKWLSADDVDAKVSLGGSFYSENIEDYYFTPFDVGYGRILKFDHDFIGRKALEQMAASGQTGSRRKVTLKWNAEDTARVLGVDAAAGPRRETLQPADRALRHLSLRPCRVQRTAPCEAARFIPATPPTSARYCRWPSSTRRWPSPVGMSLSFGASRSRRPRFRSRTTFSSRSAPPCIRRRSTTLPGRSTAKTLKGLWARRSGVCAPPLGR